MFLLLLCQGDYEVDFGLFETLNEGRAFVMKLPGYRCKTDEDGFVYESIDPTMIPDYMEVAFRGHVVPLSRFSFVNDGDIDIFWKELPVLTRPGDGMVSGTTRIDAYSVNNSEVKEYIESREAKYDRVKEILFRNGFEADRSFLGSQDGEAIVYRKKGEKDWHFLIHMDSEFAEEKTVDDILMTLNIQTSECSHDGCFD